MTTMKYLGALGLLLAACGGQANTGSSGSGVDQAPLKKAAAEAVANGSATSDACAANGWYGDKVCDSFCQDKDSDCVSHEDTATVCAEFIEASDGTCSRPSDDPCLFQDPDCEQVVHPTPGKPPTSGPGTVCAEYIEEPDGKCSRPATDPCIGQDPDCTNGSGGGGVACPAIVEQPDGKCSLPDTDPCQSIDPDCVHSHPITVCPTIVEAPDGVCSLAADDPCPSVDPDCIATADGSAGASSDSSSGSNVIPPPCCKK